MYIYLDGTVITDDLKKVSIDKINSAQNVIEIREDGMRIAKVRHPEKLIIINTPYNLLKK